MWIVAIVTRQTCTYWIIQNVLHDCAIVFVAANGVIVILRLPDWPGAIQRVIDLPGAMPLEAMQECAERAVGEFKNKMQVVRHDDGGVEDEALLLIKPV